MRPSTERIKEHQPYKDKPREYSRNASPLSTRMCRTNNSASRRLVEGIWPICHQEVCVRRRLTRFATCPVLSFT
ncbi:hypothetical protein E2C01_070617 [Portunus trituberculatus]|uniref:Uncharacterized protein n=1 Tax=Portunus trituberculatus TaxID=210409 RepID=A0A5B7HUM2_PORTR|nr:hypothetical protein [Portunus trituberculatus]